MKSKKILTILLSLAIMFTFMPAMAFAATGDGVEWDTNSFSYVKVTSGGVTTTYNHIKKIQDSATGVWTASIDENEYGDPVPGSDTDAYYIDLDGAKIGVVGAFATEYSNEAFKTMMATYGGEGDAWVFPKTTDGYATTGFRANSSSWKGTITGWEDFDETSKDEQSFTLKLKSRFPSTTSMGKTSSDPYVIGTAGTKTVNVAAPTQTAEGAEFYLNEATKYGSHADIRVDKIYGFYTGAEQTVVMSGLKGYEVAYSVYSEETGKWSAVDAVTIKDAGSDNAVQAKAVVSKGTTDKYEYTFTVQLLPVGAPSYAWNQDGNYAKGANYGVDGAEYDATSYVELTANSVAVPEATDHNAREIAMAKEYNKASKAAVAANKDELMALFNDLFTINEKTYAAKPNEVNLSFASKLEDMSAADQKALEKKYATLLTNFDDDLSEFTASGNATVYLNQAVKDNEVEFTSAVTSKTYKGSKTTKKGKLKKNQSFTVKAVCNNGAAVSYKLMNANTPKITINKSTGKITVKKGIAKGTYKFKVKAYVPGTDLFETQAITVKIKK